MNVAHGQLPAAWGSASTTPARASAPATPPANTAASSLASRVGTGRVVSLARARGALRLARQDAESQARGRVAALAEIADRDVEPAHGVRRSRQPEDPAPRARPPARRAGDDPDRALACAPGEDEPQPPGGGPGAQPSADEERRAAAGARGDAQRRRARGGGGDGVGARGWDLGRVRGGGRGRLCRCRRWLPGGGTGRRGRLRRGTGGRRRLRSGRWLRRTGSDLDARLVERAAEELRAPTGADQEIGGVADRADPRGLREALPVDDQLDRRRRLDALDRVPGAVVERRTGHELARPGGADEAARRLPGGLVLHLELAGVGEEALADQVPVRRGGRLRRLQVDRERDVLAAGVQVARGRDRDEARPREPVGHPREARPAELE